MVDQFRPSAGLLAFSATRALSRSKHPQWQWL